MNDGAVIDAGHVGDRADDQRPMARCEVHFDGEDDDTGTEATPQIDGTHRQHDRPVEQFGLGSWMTGRDGDIVEHHERVAMTQDEFVKTIVNNRPTEIYCKHWSADKPLYYIVAHYDFVQTRVRKQTPSVRIQSAFEDKAQRIYLPALYRKLTTEHQHRMPFTSLEFK